MRHKHAMLAAVLAVAVALGLQAPSVLRSVLPTEAQTAPVFTFNNGHRLDWNGCDLAGWHAPDGTLLAQGLILSGTGQSGLAYQSSSQTADTATVHCTSATGGVTITLTGVSRSWGASYGGVQWQVAINGSAPLGTVTVGLLSVRYGANTNGWQHYHMDPVWNGLQQFNLNAPDAIQGSADSNTGFTLLHRPEGALVAYIPDFSQGWENFTGFSTYYRPGQGWSLQRDFGPSLGGQTTWTLPAFNILWGGQGRGVAQQWLDARFGTFGEQWRSVGLGPHHLTTIHGGFCGGANPWNNWANVDVWFEGTWSPLYWNARDCDRPFQHTGMFVSSTGGDVNTIDAQSPLNAPDLYLPNASDLPAVIPGVTFPGQPPLQEPTGGGVTQGTIQEYRDALASERALGVFPGIWSRDYYAGCVGGTDQWSRWDKTWNCSYLWKAHPEWGGENPDGSLDPNPQAFPNFANPAYADWYTNVHKYWLDLGLLTFFKDTGCFPCNGLNWYQSQQVGEGANRWATMKALLQHGAGYIIGEQPYMWGPTQADHTGNPKFQKYEEWVYTFSGHNWAEITGGWFVNVDSDMAWDINAARRTLNVVGFHGCCTDSVLNVSPPNTINEARVLNGQWNSYQQQYGVPDHVELIGLRPGPNTTYLESAATAADTGLNVHNSEVLPYGGIIQIDQEQILVLQHEFATPGVQYCDTTQAPRCVKLYDIIRGYNGTARQAHAAGAVITPLDDGQHWDWDDAHWVYGTTAIRYSDGAVVSGTLPVVSNVQASGNTVTWTTDVPTQGWVEYDTFGAAEFASARRPAGFWPAYHWKSGLDAADLPAASTQHSVVLDHLTPGALTHYSIVTHRPVGARTTDATFTAGQTPPTATPTAPIPDTTYDDAAPAWSYAGGGWDSCNPCGDTGIWADTAHWSQTPTDTATLPFTGTQVALYTVVDDHAGIIAVSVDGGAEITINTYSATRQGNVLTWTSPLLANGTHTLRVRPTGNADPNNGYAWLTIDRAVAITAAPTPTATATPMPTATATRTPTRTPTPTATPYPACEHWIREFGGEPHWAVCP